MRRERVGVDSRKTKDKKERERVRKLEIELKDWIPRVSGRERQ